MAASRQWTHPEYSFSKGRPSIDGVQLYRSVSQQARASVLRSIDPLYILLAAFTVFITSITVSAMCISMFSVSEPVAFERTWEAFSTKFGAGNRAQFINSISIEEKRKYAGQIHYVKQVINAANSKVEEKSDLAMSIVAESTKANYDPLFVAAIVKSESTFKRGAVSRKGARGLMQLLPNTAQFASKMHDSDGRNYAPAFLTKDRNLQLGIAYLKHLEDMFHGNRELALIAYNWGPGNLRNALKRGREIPKAPALYARNILKNHARWRGELERNIEKFQFADVNGIA